MEVLKDLAIAIPVGGFILLASLLLTGGPL